MNVRLLQEHGSHQNNCYLSTLGSCQKGISFCIELNKVLGDDIQNIKPDNDISKVFQFCNKVYNHTLVGISLGEWLPVVKISLPDIFISSNAWVMIRSWCPSLYMGYVETLARWQLLFKILTWLNGPHNVW